MIDLHCHILPGLDDGSPDIAESLAMARMAVADGITAIACTPHISPGIYDNTRLIIESAVANFAAILAEENIPLRLVAGADVHMAPNLIDGLRTGRIAAVAGTRYFLLEPPHNVLPPRFDQFVFSLMAAGFVPILTHPERLAWIETHYGLICSLAEAGMPMQLTAASLTGKFGRRARYWSDRMLDEDIVLLLATDAHDSNRRPPILGEARDVLADRHGDAHATKLLETNPRRILEDNAVVSGPRSSATPRQDQSLWKRIWSSH